MFDEDDYYSDEQDNISQSFKNTLSNSKALIPSSGSDFNHLTGEGESLLKIMKDRGFDLTDNEIKKMKEPKRRDISQNKTKSKAGFFDGGDKASLQQLMKALNKAFSKADPQQASCILSYILEKKNISPEDKNKFSIMKCNILFGLGAYEDCLTKTLCFMDKPFNKLSASILSNLAAKCKVQTDRVLSGYMDLLRAKSLIQEYRDEVEDEKQKSQSESTTQKTQKSINQEFAESEIDTTVRQLSHTELEYNIKMTKYKNNTNLIYPYFQQFRHRKILRVVCGDFHTLFLVGGSLKNDDKDVKPNWDTEVFGLGEDTVGQISGTNRQIIYKDPVLISQLSGKGIVGIWANKESSLAYDGKGNIYEWGVKEKRSSLIQITYSIGEQISHLQKGYKHYALLTKSGKFYSWGKIQIKGACFYNQEKPVQDGNKIVNFSCGNNYTMAVDSDGYVYSLGNNESGQLGIIGQRFNKSFRKINNYMISDIRKVFCLSQCTFFINHDCEVFFCGKYSHKKQLQQKFRQAQFSAQFRDIVSISGSVGNYYITNEIGELYHWEVDSMVKFKIDNTLANISQRYVAAYKGNSFRVRSTIKPQLCKIKRKTQDMRTYEPIYYELILKDQLGLYGIKDFILSPKCQIFLSTYKIKQADLRNQNSLFLEGHKFSTDSHMILLNEIVESRLSHYEIRRSQQEPWACEMEIVAENSGKYFFYVLLQHQIILQQELRIQISERQKELQEKNRLEKQLREEERRRKAELQRQRLAQEKMRREMQEDERRKQTQKRAEEALKKHMRQQQEAKLRAQEQRKAKKELLTGGGFDLNKLKRKNSRDVHEKIERQNTQRSQRMQKMQKTGQSFLPNINERPNSRKKLNLPKPSELIGMVRPQKTFLNSTSIKNEIPSTTMTAFTTQKSKNIVSNKQGPDILNSTGSVSIKQGRNLKRGLSKKK